MKYLTLLTVGLLLFSSCDDDDTQAACGQGIIFTSDFENVTSDEFTIIDAEINGQCLDVTIGAGGCDGESWTVEMHRSDFIITVFPPTIPLKLALDDDELCEAFIQKTFSFDLSSIIADYSQFYVSIEGFDGTLEYTTVAIGNLAGKWNLVNINGGLQGTNQDFDPGEITWSFALGNVEIEDYSNSNNTGVESGLYTYEVTENEGTYGLMINGQNLGYIRYLTDDSFSVDQRALDGLQYVFIR